MYVHLMMMMMVVVVVVMMVMMMMVMMMVMAIDAMYVQLMKSRLHWIWKTGEQNTTSKRASQ